MHITYIGLRLNHASNSYASFSFSLNKSNCLNFFQDEPDFKDALKNRLGLNPEDDPEFAKK